MHADAACEELSPQELVQLAAVDHELYNRTFFPRAFRRPSPPFLREVDAALWAGHRFLALKMFRGSSKTTRLRTFTSKRMAYGISHTILFVSNSQGHAIKSVEWLRNAVKFNRDWTNTYGLRIGSKDSSEEVEVIHGVDEYPIRVLALGITGQVRGVNIEDYRPDLIVLDDPDNEETTHSPEQRHKTSDLTFGALAKSLVPYVEDSGAMMALAQTPLESGDLIDTCSKDAEWHPLTFGCFDENGKSRWEDYYPTEQLLADKQAHIRRNQLSLWLREMECTLTSSEDKAFDIAWLEYWEQLPEGMTCYISIDPASSEKETADFQAIAVVGVYAGKFYLCEYVLSKGKNPDEIVSEFFRLADTWSPLGVMVETNAYQKVLAWFLRQGMRSRNKYYTVYEKNNKQRKADRIIQGIGKKASTKSLVIHRSHVQFIEQYQQYPAQPSKSYAGKDDLLDAVSMIILHVRSPDAIEGEYTHVDEMAPRLEYQRGAP